MNDTELPPLEPDVLAVIDGASGINRAPASVRIRVRDRVEAAIGGGGAGGSGAGTPAAASAASSGLRASGLSVRAFAPLAVSFVLGAITSGAMLFALGVARPPFRSGSNATAGAESRHVVDEPAAPAASQAAPAVPSAAAPSSPAGSATLAHGSMHAEAPRSQLAMERHLLDKARAALEDGEPAVALSVAARHERQFPSGALAQEREAMAIRALVALGRMGDAHARAARFRASYPDSVLLSTIDEMLDAAPSR